MELSLFLAKLLGIYMLVVAVLWAVRGKVFTEIVEEFVTNRALIFFTGLLALVIGIAMAIGHSVWELSWRGVITFFAYGAILKGIVRMGFPDTVRAVAPAMMAGGRRWILIAFAFLIGAWLRWEGFGG